MDFMQTQTCQNLARSFAGESQARQRYTQYAQQARKEGFEYLARLFEQTAGNEQAHAQEFLEKLQKYGRQPIENIDFSAGYPYTLGVTMENLLEAAKGENEEAARAIRRLRERRARKAMRTRRRSGKILRASRRCTAMCFWRAITRCRPNGCTARSVRLSGGASTADLSCWRRKPSASARSAERTGAGRKATLRRGGSEKRAEREDYSAMYRLSAKP